MCLFLAKSTYKVNPAQVFGELPNAGGGAAFEFSFFKTLFVSHGKNCSVMLIGVGLFCLLQKKFSRPLGHQKVCFDFSSSTS